MTAQNSTGYPFIGEVAGERAGILVLPAVDSALFTAPTNLFSQFQTALSVAATSGNSTLLVTTGIGHMKVSFNGTVYRIPVFTNA